MIKSPIFLDTPCFIYLFENHPKYHDIVRPIFSMLSVNKVVAYTSVITVTEVLTKPYKINSTELIHKYNEAFFQMPNFEIATPDYNTAVKAAKISAKYNFSLPDSYQLAMCIEMGCETFLTNDKQLKKFKDLEVITLDELI